MHAKTFSGDVYGTLLVAGDTDVAMWNSSATTYTTNGTVQFTHKIMLELMVILLSTEITSAVPVRNIGRTPDRKSVV